MSTPEPSWQGSDYEFLDPSRPAVVYEDDLSPEDKEADAAEIAAMDVREKQGENPGMTYLDHLAALPAVPDPAATPPKKKRRRGKR